MPSVYDDPDRWQLPDWPWGWGGPFEFESLRAFWKALLPTNLHAKLDAFEESYVRLEVFRRPTRTGLVYVNRADDKVTPLFSVFAGAEDEELHTPDIPAAVAFL